jgi:LacI family transcriptional regulator
MRGVTSRDVARLAGVSRSTVSYVLNETGSGIPISQRTRERVRDAARQLGYYPNEAARTLRGKRTGMIGLAINVSAARLTSDLFLPLVLRGVASVLQTAGLKLLMEPYDAGADHYIGLVRGGRVDGIIFAGPRADPDDIRRLHADEVPLVLWGRLPGTDVPYVDIDNVASARLAVEHLLGLGHRRIACVTNALPQHHSTESDDRLGGYRSALHEAGIAFDEALVRYGNYDAESGEIAMRSLMTEAPPPTAVFVASDEVALGALRAARAHGVRIPEDVAVVGFDDIPTAADVEPPLTTVRVPAVEIGESAARLLVGILESAERPPTSVILETQLVVRSSSGAVRTAG